LDHFHSGPDPKKGQGPCDLSQLPDRMP